MREKIKVVASDYCFSIELKRVMERYSRGELLVIPMILHFVLWQGTPFGKLQALPTNTLPVSAWSNPNEALFNVSEGNRRAIREFDICRITFPEYLTHEQVKRASSGA